MCVCVCVCVCDNNNNNINNNINIIIIIIIIIITDIFIPPSSDYSLHCILHPDLIQTHMLILLVNRWHVWIVFQNANGQPRFRYFCL